MDIPLFISRFLYRIRYKLLFGSLIVTIFVAYFTQFLPKTYTVKTTIYTGLVSGMTIDGSASGLSVGTIFDNLFNLVKAQSTLENVSLRLLAMNLIYGNPDVDNTYITAENYRLLVSQVPQEVLGVVDKNSVEATVANFRKVASSAGQNFIYSMLNGGMPYYSYGALSNVEVRRVQNSDMVEISYTSGDPGITTNTVKLFNEELLASYNELRYNSTNDVIEYFENEVSKLRRQLTEQEDELTSYNVKNNIINYGEQTSSLARAYNNYRSRYEETLMTYSRAISVMEEMERHMADNERLYFTNRDFLDNLNKLTDINTKVVEMELLSSEDAAAHDGRLGDYRRQLADSERSLHELSDSINAFKYTTDGIAVDDYVKQWLEAMIEKTKAESELAVLDSRRAEYEEMYRQMSPLGTEIKRREREIGFTENAYIEMLHSLNEAYARKKNLQLTTSNLNTVNEPIFPLAPNKSKRFLLVLAAFGGSIIFIVLHQFLVEMLDRTLRDGDRTLRLTGIAPVGALVGKCPARTRRYANAWNRLSAANICSKLNRHLKPQAVNYVNIVGIDHGEGKSFVAEYLVNEWQRVGLLVKYVNVDAGFTETRGYVLSEGFDCIISDDEASQYNVVIVEHPSLIVNSIPPRLLQQASINILVANARRVWKKSDTDALKNFEEEAGKAPFKMILNNANRFDVEDYTGDLPPMKRHRRVVTRFMHIGLTSRGNAVE